MTRKKICPVCNVDITNKAYISIVYDGKVCRCHPNCANEVLKNVKKVNGVNRNLNRSNVSFREQR